MFTTKGCNKGIDRIHERSLRLILNDYKSSFYDLFPILNEKIHQRYIDVLLTQVYKNLIDFPPISHHG